MTDPRDDETVVEYEKRLIAEALLPYIIKEQAKKIIEEWERKLFLDGDSYSDRK